MILNKYENIFTHLKLCVAVASHNFKLNIFIKLAIVLIFHEHSSAARLFRSAALSACLFTAMHKQAATNTKNSGGGGGGEKDAEAGRGGGGEKCQREGWRDGNESGRNTGYWPGNYWLPANMRYSPSVVFMLAGVVDSGPTLNQYWIDFSCLLGYIKDDRQGLHTLLKNSII